MKKAISAGISAMLLAGCLSVCGKSEIQENNLYFTFGGSQTIARVSKYEISGIGDRIDFVFDPSRVHFFDKNTEVRYV